jgi:hypothetical protein
MRLQDILYSLLNLFKGQEQGISLSGFEAPQPVSLGVVGESSWNGELREVLARFPSAEEGYVDSGGLAEWFRDFLGVVQEAGRFFARALLQALLEVTVMAWDQAAKRQGSRPCPCPCCGSLVWSYAGAEPDKKDFDSLFGTVRLWRYPARCEKCGESFYPLDSVLGLGRHTMFPLLQRFSAFLACFLPESVAAQALEMLTGSHHSPRTIAARAKELGRAAAARQEAGMDVEVEILQQAAAQAEGPVDLHLSVDGTMVPLNEKPKEEEGSHKEARVAVLTLEDSMGNTLTKIRLARLTELAVFLRCLSELILEAHETIPHLRRFYLHADGALWIEGFAEAHAFLTFFLDWYHLKEKVWGLTQEWGFQRTEHRIQRLQEATNALWHGDSAKAIEILKSMRFPYLSLGTARDNVVAYIWARKDCIPNYRWHSDRSLSIGSGEVEGAAKHIITNRLKGSGMRWSPENADAIIAARCSILNGTWEYDLLNANLRR